MKGGSRGIGGQVGRFAVVGLAATGTHYLVALAVNGLAGPYPANVLGFLSAVSVSYFGHRHFTFAARDGAHRRQAPQFLVSALAGLGAGNLVLALALAAGAPPAVALALAAAAPPPVTFVLGRFWVFAPRQGRPGRETGA